MILIDKPMPESCEECPCYDDEYNYCNGLDKPVDEDIWWNHVRRRMDGCPLQEIVQCEDCKYKEACGGVFSGTISMVKDELKAII